MEDLHIKAEEQVEKMTDREVASLLGISLKSYIINKKENWDKAIDLQYQSLYDDIVVRQEARAEAMKEEGYAKGGLMTKGMGGYTHSKISDEISDIRPLIDEILKVKKDKVEIYDVELKYTKKEITVDFWDTIRYTIHFAITIDKASFKDEKNYKLVFSGVSVKRKGFLGTRNVFHHYGKETIKAFQPLFDKFYQEFKSEVGAELAKRLQEQIAEEKREKEEKKYKIKYEKERVKRVTKALKEFKTTLMSDEDAISLAQEVGEKDSKRTQEDSDDKMDVAIGFYSKKRDKYYSITFSYEINITRHGYSTPGSWHEPPESEGPEYDVNLKDVIIHETTEDGGDMVQVYPNPFEPKSSASYNVKSAFENIASSYIDYELFEEKANEMDEESDDGGYAKGGKMANGGKLRYRIIQDVTDTDNPSGAYVVVDTENNKILKEFDFKKEAKEYVRKLNIGSMAKGGKIDALDRYLMVDSIVFWFKFKKEEVEKWSDDKLIQWSNKANKGVAKGMRFAKGGSMVTDDRIRNAKGELMWIGDILKKDAKFYQARLFGNGMVKLVQIQEPILDEYGDAEVEVIEDGEVLSFLNHPELQNSLEPVLSWKKARGFSQGGTMAIEDKKRKAQELIDVLNYYYWNVGGNPLTQGNLKSLMDAYDMIGDMSVGIRARNDVQYFEDDELDAFISDAQDFFKNEKLDYEQIKNKMTSHIEPEWLEGEEGSMATGGSVMVRMKVSDMDDFTDYLQDSNIQKNQITFEEDDFIVVSKDLADELENDKVAYTIMGNIHGYAEGGTMARGKVRLRFFIDKDIDWSKGKYAKLIDEMYFDSMPTNNEMRNLMNDKKSKFVSIDEYELKTKGHTKYIGYFTENGLEKTEVGEAMATGGNMSDKTTIYYVKGDEVVTNISLTEEDALQAQEKHNKTFVSKYGFGHIYKTQVPTSDYNEGKIMASNWKEWEKNKKVGQPKMENGGISGRNERQEKYELSRNQNLTYHGFDVLKLTDEQKNVILEPSEAPENYMMDGEISPKQAFGMWKKMLINTGLTASDVKKAIQMNFKYSGGKLNDLIKSTDHKNQ